MAVSELCKVVASITLWDAKLVSISLPASLSVIQLAAAHWSVPKHRFYFSRGL